MEVLNTLKQVPLPIIIIFIAILALITLVVIYQYAKMKGLEGIRADVYQLIIKAEHFYNYGDNKQKLKYVVQEARKLLPKWMQIILTDEFMEKVIDTWFKGVKDLLDDGRVNGTQK